MKIQKIIKNNDNLLRVLGSKEDKKIIIKKPDKAKIKCLFKNKNELFKENDNTIPIIKRMDISIKLILSTAFHHIVKLKKLFICYISN